MKTITIPISFGHPTVDIIVNGSKHTFKSGVEISIDDHLAEIIENAIALAPKIGVSRSKLAQLVDGSITEITAEDLGGISTIGTYAFYNKKSLQKVTIPNNITTISTSAFMWCENLESVYLPETPPTLAKTNSFENIKGNCIFYCKTQASLEAYRSAAYWSEMAEIYSFVVEE